MPRSRKTLASAAASTDGGAGNVMTASGGLTALAAAATAHVVSGPLTMTAALSRFSGAASGTLAGGGRGSAAAVVSTGAMSATLAVPSDIADVFEMWLNTV